MARETFKPSQTQIVKKDVVNEEPTEKPTSEN